MLVAESLRRWGRSTQYMVMASLAWTLEAWMGAVDSHLSTLAREASRRARRARALPIDALRGELATGPGARSSAVRVVLTSPTGATTTLTQPKEAGHRRLTGVIIVP